MAKKTAKGRKKTKKNKAPELTIIIPAYNEESSISEAIERVHKANPDALILAVDDGSTDLTGHMLSKMKGKPYLSILHHAWNEGYGAALKHAFLHVTTPYVAFLDADLTYDPKQFPILLAEVKSRGLDCAWTNRFGGSVNEMPAIRKVGNKIIVSTFRLMTGHNIKDCTSGQRIFSTESLKRIDAESLPDGMGFISALSRRTVSHNLRYAVLPADYRERHGESKQKLVSGFLKIMYRMVRPGK